MMRLTRLTSEVGDIKGRLCDLQETALDDPSGASNRPFTSRRVLQQYLSPEGIGQFLELYKLGDLNANVINQHYVAVFATLIQIGKPEKIVYFYRHDHFADEHLPFRERQSWPQECHAFFDDFQRAQWVFCAQELRRDRLYNKRIDPERIIPIISRTHLKQGPDATVYKVEVHPDYNSLVRRGTNDEPETNTFVLKTYRRDARDLYYNELHAYKMLNHKDIAESIAQCYGTWEQNGTFNILLEYADGGTLSELLEKQRPASREERFSIWTSFFRILEPLCRIHCHRDPNDNNKVALGIHQDIKPKNILTSSNKSSINSFDLVFKLVDFGLTYFQEHTTVNIENRIRDGRGTQTFSAPEYFRNEQDLFSGHSSQAAEPSKDIWSLGCVLSLVLVWTVLGPEKVEEYRQLRIAETNRIPQFRSTAYSGCFHDGDEILPAVKAMHVQVLTACEQRDSITTWLVSIAEEMLDHVSKRPSAPQVREKYQKAIERASAVYITQDSRSPRPFQTWIHNTVPSQMSHNGLPRYSGLGLGNEHFLQPHANPDPANGADKTSFTSIPHRERPLSIGHVLHDHTSPSSRRHHDDGSVNRMGTSSPVSIGSQDKWSQPSSNYHNRLSEGNKSIQNGDFNRSGDQAKSSHHSQMDEYVATTPGHGRQSVPIRSLQAENPGQPSTRPYATIDEVIAWIKKKKTGVSIPRPVSELDLANLHDRDQIFVIDNSITMKPHKLQVRHALESLGYLVKRFDPDGIELYFTRGPETARGKDREKLLQVFDNVGFHGAGSIGVVLGKVLNKCTSPGPLTSLMKKSRKIWGASIYVLTDGVWGCDKECLCQLPELIGTTVKKMDTRIELGIQFIQVGHHPIGTWRLRELDDEWKKHGLDKDIIDHTHIEGNVNKMLLGSFDSYWDEESLSRDPNHFPTPSRT